jgi:hypothetical protein
MNIEYRTLNIEYRSLRVILLDIFVLPSTQSVFRTRFYTDLKMSSSMA